MQSETAIRNALPHPVTLGFATLLMLSLGACVAPNSVTPPDTFAAVTGSTSAQPRYCQNERVAGSRIKRLVCLTEQELKARNEDSRYLVEAMRATSRIQSVPY